MSQFDVHRNIGRQAALVPYVVVVQSAAFDARRRRVVVPLVAGDLLSSEVNLPTSPVNPSFTVEGRRVVLNPLDIVSVSLEALGPKVASLAEEGDSVVAALDEVFSRVWG
jgi:toxin CcdB